MKVERCGHLITKKKQGSRIAISQEPCRNPVSYSTYGILSCHLHKGKDAVKLRPNRAVDQAVEK